MRAVWLLVLACAAGCATDEDPRPASIAYLLPAVLRPSCATGSCHSRATRAGDLLLDGDPATVRAQLVAKKLIYPSRPASPLLVLLRGTFGDRMPPDAPLPEADIELIERWILEGAP